MTGHRPFKELTATLSRERRARVDARVTELKAEMALAELRQARAHAQGPPSPSWKSAPTSMSAIFAATSRRSAQLR